MRPSLCLSLCLSLAACADEHAHPLDAAVDASHAHATDVPDDAPRSDARDLTVRVTHPAPHPDRLCEFSVVGADDTPPARAVLRGFLAEDAFTLRGALPTREGRLAWFCDESGNLAYDPPPMDRAGSASLDAPPGPHTVRVTPEAPSSDIGAPPATGTLTGRFSEFEVHVGVYFELSITLAGSDRVVGFYRQRALGAAGHFDLALRGILRDGQRYTARWFIDLNDNGVYDVRGDHGGTLDFEGAARGVTLVHLHHQNRAWTE